MIKRLTYLGEVETNHRMSILIFQFGRAYVILRLLVRIHMFFIAFEEIIIMFLYYLNIILDF